ncbi:spindle pole body component alp14, partial [Histoplasma capsulatum]
VVTPCRRGGSLGINGNLRGFGKEHRACSLAKWRSKKRTSVPCLYQIDLSIRIGKLEKGDMRTLQNNSSYHPTNRIPCFDRSYKTQGYGRVPSPIRM